MTITYHPPVTMFTGPHRDYLMEAIESGPTFARGRVSTRWHRVRSGVRWIAPWDPDSLRESWEYWCGQRGGTGMKYPPMFTDTPPDGEPVCGTCEGRALGVDPGRPDLLFTPRDLTPPKVCPGSQTVAFTPDPDHWNRGTCRFCGLHTRLLGFGGPFASGWGLMRHAPGPDLLPPCQFHGWKQLSIRKLDDVVVCGYCDHVYASSKDQP